MKTKNKSVWKMFWETKKKEGFSEPWTDNVWRLIDNKKKFLKNKYVMTYGVTFRVKSLISKYFEVNLALKQLRLISTIDQNWEKE